MPRRAEIDGISLVLGSEVSISVPRRCWQWKEWLLGDGHDFFIPRPRATGRLAQWLQQELGVEEAALLANCKRFDVYVAPAVPKEHLATALCLQEAWWQQQGLWADVRRLCMAFDDPDGVGQGAVADVEEAMALSKCLELRRGEEAAIYACEVAMALEQRTRRGCCLEHWNWGLSALLVVVSWSYPCRSLDSF